MKVKTESRHHNNIIYPIIPILSFIYIRKLLIGKHVQLRVIPIKNAEGVSSTQI